MTMPDNTHLVTPLNKQKLYSITKSEFKPEMRETYEPLEVVGIYTTIDKL